LEIGCLELDLSRKRAFGGVGTAVTTMRVFSSVACFTIALGLAARWAIAAAFLLVPGSVWPLRSVELRAMMWTTAGTVARARMVRRRSTGMVIVMMHVHDRLRF
jgi:hypothetical protein